MKPDGSTGPNMHVAEQFQIGVIDPPSYFISTKALGADLRRPRA